jgi:hypothetical protein
LSIILYNLGAPFHSHTTMSDKAKVEFRDREAEPDNIKAKYSTPKPTYFIISKPPWKFVLDYESFGTNVHSKEHQICCSNFVGIAKRFVICQ